MLPYFRVCKNKNKSKIFNNTTQSQVKNFLSQILIGMMFKISINNNQNNDQRNGHVHGNGHER